MIKQGTLAGVLAILMWSLSVALFRSISEILGPEATGAAVYTLSAVFIFLSRRELGMRGESKRYLVVCGGLFIFYMAAFALAIGFSNNHQQTLEIGLINYLWPSLTLCLAIPIHKQRARWWLVPGIICSLIGVVHVVSGGQGLDIGSMSNNIITNPLPYGLAFGAALCWALYSNLTRLWCQNRGALAFFLLLTSIVMWLQAVWVGGIGTLTWKAAFELLLLSGTCALAYSCWDLAMQKGNLTLVAALSYFTPLLSILVAALWLGVSPDISMLEGCVLVVLGSLLCWSSTRVPRPQPDSLSLQEES